MREIKKQLKQKSSIVENNLKKIKIDGVEMDGRIKEIPKNTVSVPPMFFNSTQAVWVNRRDRLNIIKENSSKEKSKSFKEEISLNFRSESKSHKKKIKSQNHLKKEFEKITQMLKKEEMREKEK